MKQSGQIAMGRASTIEIDAVAGNLRIRGGDVDEITWQADGNEHERLEAEQRDASNDTDGPIHLGNFSGNLRLEVPMSTLVRIGSVGGNMRAKSVTGELTVDTVGGELSIRKGGESIIGTVGGNLQAKQVAGAIFIDKAGGDIALLDISGDVRSAKAGGNIALSNVQGGVRATAGGNAKLYLTPVEQNEYNIAVGHNIRCYMPPETSAQVQAHSPKLELHWPSVDGPGVDGPGADGPSLDDENTVNFLLGDGEASLTLEAGHLIEIHCQTGRGSDGGYDRDDYDRDDHDRDDHDERNIDIDFDFDLDLEGLGGLLSERVQRKVQHAMQQAETHIANAMRQVEHNIAEAEHRVAHISAKWDAQTDPRTGRRKQYKRKARRGGHAPTTPVPPSPPNMAEHQDGNPVRTVGDEERIMILKMIEDGKIDVEQAEKLLLALGDSS